MTPPADSSSLSCGQNVDEAQVSPVLVLLTVFGFMSLVGTGLLLLHVRVPPMELPSISVAASSTGIPLVGATFAVTFTAPPMVLPPSSTPPLLLSSVTAPSM